MKKSICTSCLFPIRYLLPLMVAFTAAAAVNEGGTTPDVETILARVRHAYRLAPAYRSEGTVASHIIDPDQGSETTINGTFTMQLGRPRHYRITWSQQVDPLPPQEGAVWNAGEGPRLFLGGPGTCSAMDSDRVALASATGVSMGAANFIPHLFFDLGEGTDPLARLTEVERETEGEVNGRTCHILRAKMSGNIAVRLWIDEDSLEIRRIENTFAGAPQLDMSAADEAEALRSIGSDVTEENRRGLRAALAKARASLGNVRGKTTQEHRAIDMIGVPGADAYEVPLPEGVTLTRGPLGAAAPTLQPVKEKTP